MHSRLRGPLLLLCNVFLYADLMAPLLIFFSLTCLLVIYCDVGGRGAPRGACNKTFCEIKIKVDLLEIEYFEQT